MLRKFNILYLLLPLIVFGLYRIYAQFNTGNANFYGFAENKETQINLDHPVIVSKIYTGEGQFVKSGTLLMEVTRVALDFKMSDLNYGISELQLREQLDRTNIESDLKRLRAERADKVGSIRARIDQLESERTFNEALFDGLKSIPATDSLGTATATPFEVRLAALQASLGMAVAPIDAQIAALEKELDQAGLPAQSNIRRLKSEIGLYEKEASRLKIYAPTDGLVGTIHVKEGENVPAFNTMISFYEKSPNVVVSYIHENMIMRIKTGDSLEVVSSIHPEERCLGKVTGLGHRIVEIPERLRKIPEIKTYGREVLVEIPPSNNFLQKEKVLLQWLHPNEGSIFSLFYDNKGQGKDSLW